VTMLEMNLLPAWYEKVHLHPDVDSGSFSSATFAIDFGAVVSNNPNIPAVYRDARSFWHATYLTRELNRLLDEILGCLAGKPGDRIIQMRSPFGGGKSHILTALYHAASSRKPLSSLSPKQRNCLILVKSVLLDSMVRSLVLRKDLYLMASPRTHSGAHWLRNLAFLIWSVNTRQSALLLGVTWLAGYWGMNPRSY